MESHVETVALHETARERYLNYALSVITSRALPDVRDGLKPVQRRILYGMHELRLTPDSRYVKCARIVGEVIGKYHPHGDSAVYEALVRMAQSFALRHPLVDGHGNFGSLDGDGAAAMRYTEARMAPLAVELLGDLHERIVPFRPTYDASLTEPTVLPAAFPSLLVNGATGIAVGMATNIPPHNLGEVVNACVALIEKPHSDLDHLLEILSGPDFPTGGRILNNARTLRRIYETGHGTIDLRGEFVIEPDGKRQRVVITSIPYQTDKSQLVERIADHIRGNKVPQIVDVRDESTDDVRIVLELRPGADADAAMAYLFKHTPLQTRFHVNMTCLVPALPGTEDADHGGSDDATSSSGGPMRPARIGLIELLRHFLDFRFEVVTRRLALELEELERRIHLLEGFEIVFDGLDEAIALIREARDRKDAAIRLQARFGLDEPQTDAILELRLYRLAQLEIEKIREELAEKRAAAAQLRALLVDDDGRWKLVRSELKALRRRYADERRTRIAGPDLDISYSREDYILDEDVYVILTRDGWFKRQRSFSDLSTIRVRDGDAVRWVLFGSTRRSIILFSDRGRAYTMRIDSVPATSGYGEPVQAHFDFEDGEHIVGAMVTDERSLPAVTPPGAQPPGQASLFDDPTLLGAGDDDDDDGGGDDDGSGASVRLAPQLVAVTRAGQCVRLKYFAFEAPSTVSGRRYVRLQDDFQAADGTGDAVVTVLLAGGGEQVCLATRASRALTFPVEEITLLKGAGKGVRAVQLDPGDEVLGMALSHDPALGLEVDTNRGRRQVVCPKEFPAVARGSRGKLVLQRGHFVALPPEVVVLRPDEPAPDGGDASTTASADDTGSAGKRRRRGSSQASSQANPSNSSEDDVADKRGSDDTEGGGHALD